MSQIVWLYHICNYALSFLSSFLGQGFQVTKIQHFAIETLLESKSAVTGNDPGGGWVASHPPLMVTCHCRIFSYNIKTHGSES